MTCRHEQHMDKVNSETSVTLEKDGFIMKM